MDKKYRKVKIPKYFFIIAIALFLFIGVGYSVIYSNLNLQGNVTISKNNWDIKFENPVFDNGSITNPVPTITNGTNMSMNATLNKPGDKYSFTVDLVNNSSLPSLIRTLNITSLTDEQSNYLRWKVTYDDDTELEVNDLLKAKETKKVHIYLEYKKLRETNLYPKSNVNINLNIAINFYLPEEEFNIITLTKNGSTKTIKISNLVQERTLTDFPVDDTDKAIACNNGVIPSTDNTNKIVLNNVKQNATCRIETSLLNAITNSNTEKTNITILNNMDAQTRTNINNNQQINIDLNGKTIEYSQVESEKDIPMVSVYGKLNITDTKTSGTMQTKYKLLSGMNNSMINIKGGTYKRTNTTSSEAGGTIVTVGNATINISNSTVISTNAWTIFTTSSNGLINIENSYIESQKYALSTYNDSNNIIINIKNSTLKSTSMEPISLGGSYTKKLYICNSEVISALTNDITSISNTSYLYFYNTKFSNGENKPLVNSNYKNNIIDTNISCAE